MIKIIVVKREVKLMDAHIMPADDMPQGYYVEKQQEWSEDRPLRYPTGHIDRG